MRHSTGSRFQKVIPLEQCRQASRLIAAIEEGVDELDSPSFGSVIAAHRLASRQSASGPERAPGPVGDEDDCAERLRWAVGHHRDSGIRLVAGQLSERIAHAEAVVRHLTTSEQEDVRELFQLRDAIFEDARFLESLGAVPPGADRVKAIDAALWRNAAWFEARGLCVPPADDAARPPEYWWWRLTPLVPGAPRRAVVAPPRAARKALTALPHRSDGGRSVLTIDGESLTVEGVVRVARGREPVRLSPLSVKRIQASRESVERIVKSGRPVYGVTTGFGDMENVAVRPADLLRLQENLVRSHAAGVGPPLPEGAVRAALLIRANALAIGHSGVRPAVVDLLLGMLNRGVHPVVPSRGSLGASGDLAPLAHVALVMIGEGEAMFRGRRMAGRAALRAARLRPLRLEAKEGLAVLNGTAVMAGVGCLAVADSLRLLKDAEIAASMSFEALRGSPAPFDERLARLKRHPGHRLVAAHLRRLLQGSQIVASHRGPHRVQDPYSLRCIPQVLGAVYESVNRARNVLEIEVNSATDNPLVFPEADEVVSGGNFHGQSVGMSLDFLAIGLTVLGSFAERRVARLVDARLSELPPFLTRRSGLRSGMMVLQYTAAALASENKVLAHPATADSIPTSANQEDHVSMGHTAALKASAVLENARRIVAIEYLCAAQGMEFRRPLRPGIGPRIAARAIRTRVRRLLEDRAQAADIETIVRMMADGDIARAVEQTVGPLT